MKWGWKPGIRIAGWQSWKGRWAETGWTSFRRAPSQERRRREEGCRVSICVLGSPPQAAAFKVLPPTHPLRAALWKDHPGLGVTLGQTDLLGFKD